MLPDLVNARRDLLARLVNHARRDFMDPNANSVQVVVPAVRTESMDRASVCNPSSCIPLQVAIVLMEFVGQMANVHATLVSLQQPMEPHAPNVLQVFFKVRLAIVMVNGAFDITINISD